MKKNGKCSNNLDNTDRKGLIILNTGHGKGKTTAALGILLRAWGRGMTCCVIQFIKDEELDTGEARAARQLGIEWHQLGDGFTWLSDDMAEIVGKFEEAWSLAQEKIASAQYDLVILDEFTYPVLFRWLNVHEVIAWIRANKPPASHLVITGRDAVSELAQFADLVTRMENVKHPFDKGVLAQPGIDF